MLRKIFITLIANGLAIYLAARYVPRFDVPLEIKSFSLVVGALTLINFFIRPFIKFVLTPVIILTLGLGIVLVNITTLFILDILVPAVTIDGLTAFVLSALILSAVNLVTNFSTKKKRQHRP